MVCGQELIHFSLSSEATLHGFCNVSWLILLTDFNVISSCQMYPSKSSNASLIWVFFTLIKFNIISAHGLNEQAGYNCHRTLFSRSTVCVKWQVLFPHQLTPVFKYLGDVEM